jgi:hypothetical protein
MYSGYADVRTFHPRRMNRIDAASGTLARTGQAKREAAG